MSFRRDVICWARACQGKVPGNEDGWKKNNYDESAQRLTIGNPGSLWYIIWTLTAIHYLNYPDLLASVDLIRSSWVQTPPRSKFIWPLGTPKFPLKRGKIQGGFGVSAVLPTSGTYTFIKKIRVLRVPILCTNVKEPTHSSKRVGHVVPGVVVWPCPTVWCFT